MGKNVVKNAGMPYLKVYKEIKDFCKKKSVFSNQFAKQKERHQALMRYADSWKTKHSLTAIASEVEMMMSGWSLSESVSTLTERLDKIKAKVALLEKAVDELEKAFENIKSRPDRHGQSEVKKNYMAFVNSLGQMHIDEIDNAVDRTIPRLKESINEVVKSFSIEKKQQVKNKEDAEALKMRVQTYSKYVDKHGCAKVCKDVLATINKVLNSPATEPADDTARLNLAKQALNNVEQAFIKEAEEKMALLSEVSSHSERLWADDYHKLAKILGENPRMTTTTIDEHRREYQSLSENKSSEIERVRAMCSSNYLSDYLSKLDDIARRCVERSELTWLERSIKDAASEHRKSVIKWVLIGLGIAAAIALVIVYWKVIVAIIVIGAIIGIIATKSD